MKLIDIMTETTTTIPISKKFHEWLKSKGRKGESYEDVIKRLLKPDAVRDIERSQESSDDDLEAES